MATKEEREDRKKRIDKTKDTANLIADNGLDGKVIDVYDILARSDSPVIVNLRKLNQYGITDVMVANLYENLTSSVETKDSAMDTLKSVYINLIRYINKLPNGIVIDPKTGEKDPVRSYKQAVRIGIENDRFYNKNQEIGSEIIKNMIKENILPKNFLEHQENLGIINYATGMQHFSYIKNHFDDELNDYRNKILDENNKNWSNENLEDRIKESIKYLEPLVYGTPEQKIKAYEKINAMFEDQFLNGKSENDILALILSHYTGEKIDSKETDKLMDTLGIVVEKENAKIRQEIIDKNKVLEIEAKLSVTKKDSKEYQNLIIKRDALYSNPRLKKIANGYKDDNGNLNEQGTEETQKYLEHMKNKIFAIEAKLLMMDKLNPSYMSLLDRQREFYENNPEFSFMTAHLKDENGKITRDGKKELVEYINQLRDEKINENISLLNEKIGENGENRSKLTEEELQKYLSACLVGISTNYNQETIEKSQGILKKLFPEYDFDNSDEALEKIVNKALNITTNNEYDSATCGKKLYSMRRKFDNILLGEIAETDVRILDEEMNELFEKKSETIEVNYSESELQNRFNLKSEMKFSREDEKAYLELFQKSSIGSWISSRDEALFHKYMALVLLGDTIKESRDNGKIRKLRSVTNSIKRFEEENPELVQKLSKYTPEELQELKEQEKVFEKNKMISKVLDFYQKNIFSANPDYHMLSKKDKMDYLRLTLLTREMAKHSDTPEESKMLLKLSDRAIEIMNTAQTKFIEKDSQDDNMKINEEILISEYRTFMSVGRTNEPSLEELQKEIYDKYQRVYCYAKMSEYYKLKESDFTQLKEESQEKKFLEIIKFKKEKNRERAYEISNQQQSIETNMTEEKKYEEQSQMKPEELIVDSKDTQGVAEEKSLILPNNSILDIFKKAFNVLKTNANNVLKIVKKFFIGKNSDAKNEDRNELNNRENDNAKKSAFDQYRVEGFSGKVSEQVKSLSRDGQNQRGQEGKREEHEDISV